MSWRIEGEILSIRETGFFYKLAKEGRKPNSIRLVPPATHSMLLESRRELSTVRVWAPDGAHFDAELTDLTEVGNMVGAHLWVASWKPN